MGPRLNEVFGIGELRPDAYVNRGALDERAAYLVETGRHLVIHGDSKQGKSWLRERVLPDDRTIRVQCDATASAASILQQALGLIGVRAEIRRTSDSQIEGQIDLGASGELGLKIFAKARAEGKVGARARKASSVETAAVGRTPADLAWIAYAITESGKSLVLEDFHYLPADIQRAFSFLVKALGEYGVQVIVVGVWAEDHLLSFHNGDLVGRVEDLRLEWAEEELWEVIELGSKLLNIEIVAEISTGLVADAYQNVGLLQRMAERTCVSANVLERRRARQVIGDMAHLEAARRDLASQMAGRFVTFATRLSTGRTNYGDVLQVVLNATDAELMQGIPVDELVRRCNQALGRRRYRAETLRERLQKLAEIQSASAVFPPVLSFDLVNDRLFLVDRALLFYRKYGGPTWRRAEEEEK